MINSTEFRERGALALEQKADGVTAFSAFVGLDGFVDEIMHVVDTRADAEHFERIKTITEFSHRVGAAAGKSTNIELVCQRVKLGGNGPILGNALSHLGLRVSYLGALGFPAIHPIFENFVARADVHSIAQAGHTNALEFDDGKLMLSTTSQLNEVTWANIQERFGRDAFISRFAGSDLVAFVNWTMIPYMSDLWESLLTEVCPNLNGPRRTLFVDLADPQKREDDDLRRALELLVRFNDYFDVVLGLNEKESYEVSEALGNRSADRSPEALGELALDLNQRVPVNTIVIHPVTYALTASNGTVDIVKGPHIPRPVITTGAGDHFNAGFCLGKLLGFDNALALLTGVSTSGFYVKNGHSPAPADLAAFLRDWPGN